MGTGYLSGGHVDDVGLVGVAQFDVPIGEMVQPGQLSARELFAALIRQSHKIYNHFI